MRKNMLLMMVLTASVLAGACGGGGGLTQDSTPPSVSSTSPENGVTGVAVNSAVMATFSEAVAPGTIGVASFTVNNGVSGTVAYDAANHIVTLTPSTDLAPATTYIATISSSVKDMAGNSMVADYTWSFTTGVAPDTTPPVVSSTTPTNNATDVAINAAISATLSEPLNCSTVTTATFLVKDAGNTPVSGTVGCNGTTVTFTPTSALAYSTIYTATVTTGMQDLAGNALSAADYTWSFTTGVAPDTTPPVVSSTTPTNSATGVAINAAISATLSEPLNCSTVTTATFLMKDAGNTPVSGTVGCNGTTVTFTPTSALAYSTIYTATVTTGMKDLAGNALSAADYTWSFTTGVAPDTTPPVVSSTTPTNNATGVVINAAISATLSEPLNCSTVTTATFLVKDAGNTPVGGTVGCNGTTVTFTPTSALAYSTIYTATVTTGMKDLAGNALSADVYWNFTTQASLSGKLDTTYNQSGTVTTAVGTSNDEIVAVALQADGKVVAAGYVLTSGVGYDFGVARYNADGTLDTSFNTTGKVVTKVGTGDGYPRAVALQADGKIVVAGYAVKSTYEFAVVRYNTDGSLDTTFNTIGKVITDVGSGMANAVAIQADGKIVVAGYSFTGTSQDFIVVRYNSDGGLDTTFDADGIVTTAIGSGDEAASALAIQSDGKIVAAGYTSAPGGGDFAIVRYNADGSLDATFNTTGMVMTAVGMDADFIYSVAIQSDGKIVAAGSAANATDTDFALVRYNADGSLDMTFGENGKVMTGIGTSNDYVSDVAIQPDGKIIAAGYVELGAGCNFGVVRYNADGSLDTSFNTTGKVTTAVGTVDSYTNAVILQDDGKIVAGGAAWTGADYDFALVRYWP